MNKEQERIEIGTCWYCNKYGQLFEDGCEHCVPKLDTSTPTVRVILDTPTGSFQGALTALLNKYSMEGDSNTPDYILAEYLMRSLRAFNDGVNLREKWYHRATTDMAQAVESGGGE